MSRCYPPYVVQDVNGGCCRDVRCKVASGDACYDPPCVPWSYPGGVLDGVTVQRITSVVYVGKRRRF